MERRSGHQNLLQSQLVLRAILLLLAASVLLQTAEFSGWLESSDKQLVDFDAFYITGQLVWRGEIEQAYEAAALFRLQQLLGGAEGSMPWTYPPQFNLVVALFPLVPLGVAYLCFTSATLLAYLWILRRLAGENFGAVLLAIFPALIVTIACGQNGFMMGALAGLVCLGFLNRTAAAGLPLGLMVLKPHLAAGFAIYAVMARRWHSVAVAGAVVVLSSAVTTLALGTQVWPAFLQGVHEARGFLAEGLYPLYRMISAYSVMRSWALSASAAMAIQVAIAAAAILVILAAIWRRMALPNVLGLAALASLLVSPYVYDYDLPVYGIALALLLPELLRLATRIELTAILGLSWVVGIVGAAQRLGIDSGMRAAGLQPPAITGVALLLLAFAIWRIVDRDKVLDPLPAPAGA